MFNDRPSRSALSRRGFVALFAIAPLFVACSDDGDAKPAPSAPGTYVGTVKGTDIRVGIVTSDTEAIAFFCGGASTLASTRWLRGNSTWPDVSLTADPAKVTAKASANSLDGTFEPGDGQSLPFSATRVSDDGAPGLYDATDTEGHAGVVVTAADALQGAFRTNDGRFSQIVPIRPGPIDLQSGAFAVRIDARELNVLRVRLR